LEPKERFFRALRLQEVDRPPVVAPTNSGAVVLMEASGCYWPEAQREVRKMVGLSRAAAEVAGLEALTVPFDKYIEAEAMGCSLQGWGRDHQPHALPLITNPKDLGKVRLPDPEKTARMGIVLEAVRTLASEEGDGGLPVLAAVASPFEIASTLWDPHTLINYIEFSKDPLKELLDQITDVVIAYSEALFGAGADAITFIDGNSQNLIGTPMDLEYAFNGAEAGAEVWEEFSSHYLKKVISSLDGETILHLCGNPLPVLEHMPEVGVRGLSLDQVEIREAKRRVGRGAALLGNVSVETLAEGEPEEVYREASRALEEGVDLLSPGCNLPTLAPLENLKAMAQAAKEYKKGREA
jgi:[methyl-Co(III) methanol-specific corrinoid protein]:coenzyme M methyltransferase